MVGRIHPVTFALIVLMSVGCAVGNNADGPLDFEADHGEWSADDRRHRRIGLGAQMPERLLTLKETAEYLRLTPGALNTQRHRGEKPGALGIRVGRKILYRPSDIDRFLDEMLSEAQLGSDR